MKKLVKVIVCIIIGIFMIPALYAFGLGILGTVLAFLSNPKVMLILLLVFAVISFPGVVIARLFKK